ncbi:GST1 [Symbiodinium natans]|uniref:GST1 protein n=1 Tax=Symbiodinium natans TaxID=878477 RepID=A0A812R2B6_9DINO|nr:GST1 [Symbiodinium natans]
MSRLTFIAGGIPFKDTTPKTDETFKERTAALHPYAPDASGLPILTVDGKAYAQSRAILRYVGRIAQYEGSALYPTDPMEQLECDDYIELGEDLRGPILATFRFQDQAEKEAARAALVAPDGGVTKFLKVLDKKLGDNFPTKLTIGPLYVWCMTTIFRQPTFLDGIPADALAPYANITKLHQWISNIPPIKAHYEKAEGRSSARILISI